MLKNDLHQTAENIVQLPSPRRLLTVPVLRVTRPQALAVVPFEAWVAVRDRVAAALLGGTRCMLITGAAGTGKTMILEDVARVLRAAGRSVLVRQADADPTPPERGETLFVDEADRLTQAKLRQLMDASAGTVVLAGLGTLAQKAAAKTMHLTLAPLGQEMIREYAALWLKATGRTPAQLDSGALRQLAEASGGVPRLLSTLLGAGAWLAESGGAASITAAHIQEAAELRSVLSVPPVAGGAADPLVPGRWGRVVWSVVLAGSVLAGIAVVVVAARPFPAETERLTGQAESAVIGAQRWLSDASGKPVKSAPILPPITPHVVPRPEPAVVARLGAVAERPLPELAARQMPELSAGAEAIAVPTLASPANEALLPIETRELLVRRGHQMAAVEDLSAARLLFRRAAEGGSAEAMYELGRTYDPALRTGLGSAQADKAEAMRWYRRAAAQGDTAATAALTER